MRVPRHVISAAESGISLRIAQPTYPLGCNFQRCEPEVFFLEHDIETNNLFLYIKHDNSDFFSMNGLIRTVRTAKQMNYLRCVNVYYYYFISVISSTGVRLSA